MAQKNRTPIFGSLSDVLPLDQRHADIYNDEKNVCILL